MLKHGEPNPLNVHQLRRVNHCPPHFEQVMFEPYATEKQITDWLYENLWIWSTITVSKAEHKNENIQIDSNSIDEKRHLKHYLNVSNFYEKDSSKRYTKKLIFD